MILIPSLEILSGQLVRLAGSADSKPVVLSKDPLKTARDLRHSGAMFFHVVDLDAVLRKGNNNDVLTKLAEDMVPFQVRGRITTAERADEIMQLGADRVVLGSLPYRDGKAAKELVKRFGMRVMATLDVKGDRVLTGGREDQDDDNGIDLAAAIKKLKATGVQQVIYNSVESAGEDADLDVDKLKAVITNGAFRLYARCTVHKPQQLEPLSELHEQGLLGVILNHALAKDSAPFAKVLKLSC
jgi:phosphoribosylformimino-5-aminoimidazole carboxamide ribotide isomerase